MILFLGGAEIAIVLFILIAILAGSVEAIINMIGIFVSIFIVKNVVQTIILGFIKNKNPLSYTIGFFVTDIVRMAVFFFNLSSVGITFANASGLRYFAALFGFILYFLICGSIFLVGEFVSLVQALGNKGADQNSNNKLALFGGIGTVILLIIVTWIGYL